MKIGFLGTGTMATAMVQAIADDGHEILVSERSRANAEMLTAAYKNVSVADNRTVVDCSEIVFLGLIADVARELLPVMEFRPDQRVFSMMAGISLGELSELVPGCANLGVAVPFTFVKQGNSPMLVYPKSDLLQDLYGRNNHLIALSDEEALNDYLAAQAVLSPVVKILEETKGWLADRTGDSASAERFLRILIGGFLLADPADKPDVLASILSDLDSEGGLNAQIRDYVGDKGGYELILSGLGELEQRLKG